MAKKDNDKSDFMSRAMDERVEQLEERLTALYANAANEIKSEYTDFMAAYEKEDNARRAEVESGQMKEDEYLAWRRNQILKSNQYTKAVESMTNMLVKTDVAAMAMVNGELPSVVAESYDFVEGLGFQAAEEAGITAGTFQVYNAESVQALIRDNPDLMPAPKVDIPEDKKWNKDRINREITQGIVQGKSITKIADSLQKVTTMDRNAAIRNARTAMTGAENLGRSEAAADLKEKGIPTQEVWSATYDDRVRDTHLLMDGTTRDENGYFGTGIVNIPLRFPGDPRGEPGEVYNCRCRLNIVLQGIDHSQDGDLYEKFMKENYPEDYAALKENETEIARAEARERALERQAELRSQGIDLQEPASVYEKAIEYLPDDLKDNPAAQLYAEAVIENDYDKAGEAIKDLSGGDLRQIFEAVNKAKEETPAETNEPTVEIKQTENKIEEKTQEEKVPEETIQETTEEKVPEVQTFETKTFDNPRDATEYFRGTTYDSSMGTMGRLHGFGVRDEDNRPATKWEKKLTYDQRVAVTDYTGNSYEPVNNLLRGIWDKSEAADMMTGNYTVNKEIKLLDAAIKKYDLKVPITVHRTCEQEFVDQLEVGSTFHDDGYGSTTVVDQVVASGNVFMEIDVPAGRGVGAYVDGLSWKEGEEFEFLLARGADYAITEKEIREDGIYVKAVVTGFTPKDL